MKLESCGWTQKKRLEILFPAVVVTFGLRSSANRRVKVPSVIIQKVKDNIRPKILPRVPSTLVVTAAVIAVVAVVLHCHMLKLLYCWLFRW